MLNSTDKFLVNDGSVTETVNWSEIVSEANPMVVSVVLTPDEPEVNEAVIATPVTTGGDSPYTYTYQWVTADNALGLNQTELAGATANTYTPISANTGKFLGCVVVATDDVGNTATGTGYATNAVELALVIAKPTVLTPPDGAGIGGDVTYTPKTSAITNIADVPGGGVGTGVTSNGWYSVTYGNGRFVAVGNPGANSNTIMYSTDGINWAEDAPPIAGNAWVSVTYGDGKFVAVSSGNVSNRVMYSPTGEAGTWTNANVTGVPDYQWASVTYGNGRFVAVARGGTDRVMYSSNGLNWTVLGGIAPNSWYSVTFGDGKFVAVAYDGNDRVMYSDTGTSWVLSNSASVEFNQWLDVTYGDGKFVAVADNGANRVMYSSDGIDWNPAEAAEDIMWNSVTYGNGKFVATGLLGATRNQVMYSTDGINWTSASVPETNAWNSVTYGGDKFVSVSYDGTNRVMYSYDGTTWDGDLTQLTLTDAKTYNNDGGEDMETAISKTFKAGDTVKGENATGTYGTETAAFTTTLYTGKNEVQTIDTGVDNTGKSMIWFKCRTSGFAHALFDTLRGKDYVLSSDNTIKQIDASGDIVSFNSNGVTINNVAGYVSRTFDYVAWNFRAAPGFFDVVTYEGDSAIRDISHDLGVAPGCMILKNYTEDDIWWAVYHKELGATKNLWLNKPDGESVTSIWNNTEPTATHFTVANNSNTNPVAPNRVVAYLFADTPGKIKCGGYAGNGSGRFTEELGFKPGWLLLKATNFASNNWVLCDSKRFTAARTHNAFVNPDKNDAEDTTNNNIRFTDTGFESLFNTAGYEYIYVAIAEDVTAGEFAPTGTLTADADDATKTITLTDVTGTWEPGMEVINDTEATKEAPGADSIVFTSSKPAIESGSVVSWGAAEWELSVDSGFVDKQESSVFLADSDPEQGPTNFTLEDDTEYWVRTRYNSGDPATTSEWSEANKFKTAGASGGAYGNFSTTLYTGNGETVGEQVVDTGIDNTNKSMLWIKVRNNNFSNVLFDTERGVENPLYSNSTDMQTSLPNSLREFNSNGFKCGSHSVINYNTSSNYVAWNFAAAEGFFDVVSYKGNGGVNTLPHSLNTEPGMIIVKSTSLFDGGWCVYHKSLGAASFIRLDTNAVVSNPVAMWNYTDPTDKQFELDNDAWVNSSDEDYVAYLFADNPDGGIKCGSYDGTALNNWYEEDCGFKPGWVMIKRTDASASWAIQDRQRPGMELKPNEVNAETNEAGDFELTETGFKVRSGGSSYNYPDGKFIYVAIADSTIRFYDEKTSSTVTNHTLTKRYGVDPLTTDLKKYGIYPLTEQPTYAVAAYVRENGHYKPIRSYLSEVNRANQAIDDMQAAFETRIAALESEE